MFISYNLLKINVYVRGLSLYVGSIQTADQLVTSAGANTYNLNLYAYSNMAIIPLMIKLEYIL